MDGDWFSVAELAFRYQRSRSWVQGRLREAEKALEPSEIDRFKAGGLGPKGYLYAREFVEKVLPDAPSEPDALRRIFGRTSAYDGIIRISDRDKGPLVGILESRHGAEQAYRELVQDLVGRRKGLRIRVLSGTDFFNSHREAKSFKARKKLTREPVRVLLLYPFGCAAETRSAAEDEPDLATSQFSRDAQSTFQFVRDKKDDWNLHPKWVDSLHHSFLVWSEEFALVEAYDHGRPTEDYSGCIGRNAPLSVVQGGTPYHNLLKAGFDYVFDGTSRKTRLETYSLTQLSRRYSKSSGAARDPGRVRAL